MILKLTWRNLWRNRRRTLITTSSVTFAVLLAVLMQSFQIGIFNNLIRNVVEFYYGYAQIHKKGYWDEQVLDNCFTTDTALERTAHRIDGVRTIVPRLETFMLAASLNRSSGCLLSGTDPELEDQLTGLRQKLIQGHYFLQDERAVLLAAGLAERLALRSGDSLVLLGQGFQGTIAAGKIPICGIVRFGSPALNDRLVFLPLISTQELLGAENQLTSYAVSLEDPAWLEAVTETLKQVSGEKYEVLTWKEMMPEIANHIRADGANAYLFTGILYLIIAFGLFGTLLMMTAERKYEWGMLIAIGMKRTRLALMMLYESISIALLGAAIGFAGSLPLVLRFREHPIRIRGRIAEVYERFGFEAIFPTVADGRIFIVQTLIVLGIALLIGLYPVWHVLRIDPSATIKR
ncbi:MAG: hypothetical protein RJA57_1511 [Bacteroidota bacterium]|jgi:ABC-type lipoprotein release transport system permease subunit